MRKKALFPGMTANLAMACAALPGILFAAAQTPITIANQDQQLSLLAGASAPQLLRLSSGPAVQWEGVAPESLIDHIIDADQPVAVQWQYDARASRVQSNAATFVYRSRSPELSLEWEWRARAEHGPFEHTIRIENRSRHEIWIPLQDSFRFGWKVPASQALQEVWIDKGAGEAPPVGTHFVNIGDGYDWRGESSTLAHPRGNEPREIIPYFFVRTSNGAANRGWYAGVEFSGRIAMKLKRHSDMLEGSAGLNDDRGGFRTRLGAGEIFTAPVIFVGAGDADVDAAGNVLRRWVREVLNDSISVNNSAYPLTVNNSWGSAMAIDEVQAKRMIDDAHALGFEMFHVDAGWFRGVGDWHPDPKKFPNGIAAIAGYAHARNMKFGLWVDWAQAGKSTEPGALNVDDPKVRDWLTTDPPPGWKPAEFKGITIDLGVPAAKAWAAREVDRIVSEYKLDMLEHDGYVVAQTCDRTDHPHAVIDEKQTKRYSDDEFLWVDSSNSTDVSYHASNAYYEIHAKLKRDHPGLMLEICNDGGRTVDFGSAAHGDYFSIIDSYDPVSNRAAFYDASHLFPSAMLENYVKEWPAPRIENFRYMLRSGMMGWFTLMIDTTHWSREQHDTAQEELRFYKTQLRPLIREADLYHVGPRADGKGWDGVEYFDARRGSGALYAFHGSDEKLNTYTFVLKGLRTQKNYRVRFRDHSSVDFTASGRQLMQAGVPVSLPLANSSELMLIEAVQ